MSTRRLRIVSSRVEETLRIGALLGEHLTGGSVVALDGELGSGKTCLTQGIARGLGVPEALYVTSPSYALVNEYPGRLPLVHVDLYRVEDVSELEDLGLDEILASGGATVIEWADRFLQILPEEHLGVSIAVVDEQTRELYLTGYGRSAINLVDMCSDYDRAKDMKR